jgi:hypothetical protein
MTSDEKIDLIGNFEEMVDKLLEDDSLMKVTHQSKNGGSITIYWVGKVLRVDIKLKEEE